MYVGRAKKYNNNCELIIKICKYLMLKKINVVGRILLLGDDLKEARRD